MSDESSEARRKALAAKKASAVLALTSSEQRDAALVAMAEALMANMGVILEANALDMAAASDAGTPAPLLDRLLLDEQRVSQMADALRQLSAQADTVGHLIEERTIQNGLRLQKVSVPLGVVAIIYEARPNVTSDAAGLCIRSANACVLRGGSLAHHSCIAITGVLADACEQSGLPRDCIQSIEDVSHEATQELMGLRGLIDVLIPRGGSGLIRSCVDNATVPVIETGTGNCHIYLHEKADVNKAVPICVNAKTQRPGVCNATESLLVDECAASSLLPPVLSALANAGVTLHCDKPSLALASALDIPNAVPAVDDDWGREYLDLEMSVKCVSGLDEAIEHVNRYGTGHSESIVSEDANACEAFLTRVDAAAVYSNASTRFTDGGVFGLGAEIGISTQKLHVRGPMGAAALSTMKYEIRGNGQVR